MKPTPVTLRIPLLDVSKAYVSPRSEELPGGRKFAAAEILVRATNPHVEDRTVWQHEAVCDYLRRQERDANNHADYKLGFLRLFENALRAMGVEIDGTKSKGRLTGAQGPRMASVFLEGLARPAMSGTKKIVDRFDPLKEFDQSANGTAGAAAPVWHPQQDLLAPAPDDPILGTDEIDQFDNEPIEDD